MPGDVHLVSAGGGVAIQQRPESPQGRLERLRLALAVGEQLTGVRRRSPPGSRICIASSCPDVTSEDDSRTSDNTGRSSALLSSDSWQ
jgi:hypothetical protein